VGQREQQHLDEEGHRDDGDAPVAEDGEGALEDAQQQLAEHHQDAEVDEPIQARGGSLTGIEAHQRRGAGRGRHREQVPVLGSREAAEPKVTLSPAPTSSGNPALMRRSVLVASSSQVPSRAPCRKKSWLVKYCWSMPKERMAPLWRMGAFSSPGRSASWS